jgi:hypothetical protein
LKKNSYYFILYYSYSYGFSEYAPFFLWVLAPLLSYYNIHGAGGAGGGGGGGTAPNKFESS